MMLAQIRILPLMILALGSALTAGCSYPPSTAQPSEVKPGSQDRRRELLSAVEGRSFEDHEHVFGGGQWVVGVFEGESIEAGGSIDIKQGDTTLTLPLESAGDVADLYYRVTQEHPINIEQQTSEAYFVALGGTPALPCPSTIGSDDAPGLSDLGRETFSRVCGLSVGSEDIAMFANGWRIGPLQSGTYKLGEQEKTGTFVRLTNFLDAAFLPIETDGDVMHLYGLTRTWDDWNELPPAPELDRELSYPHMVAIGTRPGHASCGAPDVPAKPPSPGAGAQRALICGAVLHDRAAVFGGGDWVVGEYANGPYMLEGQHTRGGFVPLHQGDDVRHLPIETDGDVADFYRMIEKRGPRGVGTQSKRYRRVWGY